MSVPALFAAAESSAKQLGTAGEYLSYRLYLYAASKTMYEGRGWHKQPPTVPPPPKGQSSSCPLVLPYFHGCIWSTFYKHHTCVMTVNLAATNEPFHSVTYLISGAVHDQIVVQGLSEVVVRGNVMTGWCSNLDFWLLLFLWHPDIVTVLSPLCWCRVIERLYLQWPCGRHAHGRVQSKRRTACRWPSWWWGCPATPGEDTSPWWLADDSLVGGWVFGIEGRVDGLARRRENTISQEEMTADYKIRPVTQLHSDWTNSWSLDLRIKDRQSHYLKWSQVNKDWDPLVSFLWINCISLAYYLLFLWKTASNYSCLTTVAEWNVANNISLCGVNVM